MELLMFILPSLLVAMAYLVPVAEAEQKTTGLPQFGSICGCKR